MIHGVSFHGTGTGYFKVWIVNTLLKVITLGAYSAWAKVRKRRYFAEKTILDDEPFEYLANPRLLFRGWLIAAAVFIVYGLTIKFTPILGQILAIAITAVIPWVVVKSRIFNARNTAYRNVRFGYAPNYKEAYMVMLLLPLLLIPTLGILYPYVRYRQKRLRVENTSYGTTPFRFYSTSGEFYKLFLKALLWFLGAMVLVILISGIGGRSIGLDMKQVYIFSFVLGFLSSLLTIVYIETAITNLTWNSTELDSLQFGCSLNPLVVFWLYFSGAIAVILSFGLLFPWASVRIMRYQCEQMTVHSKGGIALFVAEAAAVTSGAVGEEVGDMFDMDMEIGF